MGGRAGSRPSARGQASRLTPALPEEELHPLLVLLLLQGQLAVHLQALSLQGRLQPVHQPLPLLQLHLQLREGDLLLVLLLPECHHLLGEPAWHCPLTGSSSTRQWAFGRLATAAQRQPARGMAGSPAEPRLGARHLRSVLGSGCQTARVGSQSGTRVCRPCLRLC